MMDDAQSRTRANENDIAQNKQGIGLATLAVTGGMLGAVAASFCCVLPLALAVFGVGGAWMSGLRVMAPYQPFFIALAIGAVGYGFYRVHWRNKQNCTNGDSCARPLSDRLVKSALWLASAIIAVVITFPYWFGFAEPYLP